jgi:transcription antitermination factor NusA-like protein
MFKDTQKNNEVYEIFSKAFPLVRDGTIEIRGIARGFGRVVVAVFSKDTNTSALGVLSENLSILEEIKDQLGGDKISLFIWSEDPKQLIESALDPIFVDEIVLDESSHTATVKSIGAPRKDSEEQKACRTLAEELTGWNILLKM